MKLPINKKLNMFNEILDFIKYTNNNGYVAVDFYDGSIMYDFEKETTMICDIDFFRKKPTKNDMGRMWGSERFISPEECTLGAPIDENTNIYTLGQMAFSLFTDSDRSEESWCLSKESYQVLLKATDIERNKRFHSISEFHNAWLNSLDK